MNIAETWQKIKGPLVREASMPLLIILVGIGSFGLGRLSAQETAQMPVQVSQAAAAAVLSPIEGGRVVASKTGSKYYFPWCAAALKIGEESKVWFESEEKARTAGYLPAGNCKGLQ